MHIHCNPDDQHSQPLDIPWDDFESYLTNPDVDPMTLDQAKKSVDWPQWEKTLHAEYQSLRKRGVFGPLVTDLITKPIGYKLIFTRKRDEHAR